MIQVCRRKRLGCQYIMDDGIGHIQETGQEKRPARMVGLSSLDFAKFSKEADSRVQAGLLRQWRGGNG